MDFSPSQTVSEMERAGTQTHTWTRSWQAVVYSSSLKEIISQLLIQMSPQVHQTEVDLNACDLLLDLLHLLCSSCPWVQVTEEKQEANSLLQPTAPYQMMVPVSGDGPLPAKVTVSSDGLLPAMVTVSSDVVEDLLIQLMLKLHPLNGFGVKQLSQQELLALCLHMSAVTLETLRRVPGIAVDTELAPPLFNLRRPVLLLQSSLIRMFGTSIKLKKLLAMRDPALLSSIPNGIIEAVLTVYQSISQAHQADAPIQAPREEDEMERRLFSQLLPERLRERMFQEYGTWIRNTKLFMKALPPMSDQDILEYRLRVSEPSFSNRDVVWVDGRFFVANDYEEDDPENIIYVAENPLALDCSQAAFLKQFPKTHIFVESDADCSCGPEGKHKNIGSLPSFPPAQPCARDSAGVKAALTSGKALVQESTVRLVLAELFRGQDETFDRPQHLLNCAFEKELVEHVHLLLQKESVKYQENRVFLRTLERLTDPRQEVKLSEELSWPLKQALGQALPHTWLSREGLMEDTQVASLACSLIANEILEHLKPSVRFTGGTKSGDDTPYSVNIPVKREDRETDRPLTQPELSLQKQHKESREESCTTAGKDGAMATKLKGKSKKKWCSWLCGLFSRKKT